jgi:hypothetical protein
MASDPPTLDASSFIDVIKAPACATVSLSCTNVEETTALANSSRRIEAALDLLLRALLDGD